MEISIYFIKVLPMGSLKKFPLKNLTFTKSDNLFSQFFSRSEWEKTAIFLFLFYAEWIW